MHIAIVTETFPPEINGVAMTLNQLANGLAERGHEVQVVRPRQKKSVGEPRVFPEILVPGFPLPGYKGLRFGMPSRFRLIRKWREKRPDVLYVATEGPLGFAAISAARKLRIPVTSGFHTHFDQYMSHYKIPGAQFLIGTYLRWIHNQTWCTYTPSPHTRDSLVKLGLQRVKVLGRGVDTTQFNPAHRSPRLRESWGVSGQDTIPLFVSRIALEKNLGLAARACSLIQEVSSGNKPVWVGDGPEREHMEAEFPQFHFAGMRTGLDLSAHYASGDLFIFPSTTETFGNVVTEAMASGLIVVAYDYAAPSLYIEDGVNGFLAPFDDEKAYLLAVERAMQARERWPQMRAAARQTAEGLGWGAIINQFADTLEEAARSTRP